MFTRPKQSNRGENDLNWCRILSRMLVASRATYLADKLRYKLGVQLKNELFRLEKDKSSAWVNVG